MLHRIETWIARIVRAEIRSALGEMKAHADDHANALREHVSSQIKKTIRRPCAACGRMSSSFETVNGVTRCSECIAKGRA